jgi:hypothetical protein
MAMAAAINELQQRLIARASVDGNGRAITRLRNRSAQLEVAGVADDGRGQEHR